MLLVKVLIAHLTPGPHRGPPDRTLPISQSSLSKANDAPAITEVKQDRDMLLSVSVPGADHRVDDAVGTRVVLQLFDRLPAASEDSE